VGKHALLASIALIVSGSTFAPAPGSPRERPTQLDVEAFTDAQVAGSINKNGFPARGIVTLLQKDRRAAFVEAPS